MHFGSQPAYQTPPSLTFVGPDDRNVVSIQSATGMRTPLFFLQYNHSKPQLTVHRILPHGQQQLFFSASTSSASGSITLILKGQELKVRHSYEGMQPRKEFHSQLGKLSWMVAGWGDTMELWTQDRRKLARFQMKTLSGHGGGVLELYGRFDDAFTDLMVATALCMYRESAKEVKHAGKLGKVMKAVGKLGGEGGGGDGSGGDGGGLFGSLGGDGGGASGGDGGGGAAQLVSTATLYLS
ncbi:hypothetical protein EJ04DRAFT_553399 [Polyplosphaeria fusca]|uniref:Uncharacterized protein n=1 Tax=Polyplosphaeria fusca TaxID=682080 RepID=A0A9P4QYR7_9PLEO|nr:hypothetical protein EJ04DRAFT_553399 [Polyplosphaeria fusca]